MSYRKEMTSSVVFRVIQFLSSFLVNFFISRLYGADASGELFYVTSILALLLMVASFNLDAAICYYYSRKQLSNKTAFAASCIVAGLATLISWVLLQYFWPQFISGYLKNTPLLFPLFFIAGNFLITLFQLLCYINKEYKVPFKVIGLANILFILFLLLWSPHHNADTAGFIARINKIYLALFMIEGVVLAAYFYLRFVANKQEPAQYPVQVSRLLQYGGTALLANVVSFLVYRVDYWFVARYCSKQDLGNYIQVNKIATIFFLLPSMLSVNIFIHASAGSRPKTADYQLEQVAKIIALAYLPVIILLACTGKYLFPFIFGATYQLMYSIFLLMAAGIFCFSILKPFASYFAAHNKVYINLAISLTGVLLLIVLDSLFVPIYGVSAAAISCGLVYVLEAVLGLLCYRYISGSNMGNLFRISRKEVFGLLKAFKKEIL